MSCCTGTYSIALGPSFHADCRSRYANPSHMNHFSKQISFLEPIFKKRAFGGNQYQIRMDYLVINKINVIIHTYKDHLNVVLLENNNKPVKKNQFRKMFFFLVVPFIFHNYFEYSEFKENIQQIK